VVPDKGISSFFLDAESVRLCHNPTKRHFVSESGKVEERGRIKKTIGCHGSTRGCPCLFRECNCTLCDQVCPTGALKKLTLPKKYAFVIGRAVFDKNRCLPYASATPCIVCEEHCPTSDKAIKFKLELITATGGKKMTLKQPYVVTDLCVGCGICEKICPVAGPAAVRVYPMVEKL